ncbi:MAG: hypothetical protein LQ350_005444 [Teloschistes chrysophthalmus]|nr:MAG: hypothetical protein LQ350_005444 [Niorma chrysophthalma]
MAGLKRKIQAPSIPQKGSIKKQKQKQETKPTLKTKVPATNNIETETDSDPIVESETPEFSGEDDGVSWPSEDDDRLNSNQGSFNGQEDEAGFEDQGPANVTRPKSSTTDPKGLSTSSKESHAKQKALAQERRASKPNADSIARSKKLWERLRRKSHVPLAERKKLVAELFDIVTGHVKDYVLKHDSVRVIQTAIKYANLDQRRMIAKELKGEYRGLAESRYAKFLVGKLLVHGDKETRDLIVPEFYGHVRRMIKHPEASWILDDIYRGAATTEQKAILLREWYGAEFSIFKHEGQGPVSAELKAILAESPEKRKPLMHALHEMINLLIQKKTTAFTMLHDAMLQYLLNITPGSTEMTDFIELLKGDEEGDLLKNLAFTKSGARVVCLALAYGNAKDRKQILRVYKNTFSAMAYDANAHQVILAAYDVIDDTILLPKTIFPELLGTSSTDLDDNQRQALLNAITDLNARIPFLYLFAGKAKAILPAEDLDMLNTIHAIRTSTSKKDPNARRKELLTHLSPPLLRCIAADPALFITSSFGCQFVTEVLLGAPTTTGAPLTNNQKTETLNAIVALVVTATQQQEQQQSEAIKQALDAPSAGKMLKTLVQGGRFNPQTRKVEQVCPPLDFHNLLFTKLQEGQVVEWACGKRAFIVLAFLEAEGFAYKKRLRVLLGEGRGALEGVVAAGVEEEEGKKGGGGGGGGNNRGTRMLLEKLDAYPSL